MVTGCKVSLWLPLPVLVATIDHLIPPMEAGKRNCHAASGLPAIQAGQPDDLVISTIFFMRVCRCPRNPGWDAGKRRVLLSSATLPPIHPVRYLHLAGRKEWRQVGQRQACRVIVAPGLMRKTSAQNRLLISFRWRTICLLLSGEQNVGGETCGCILAALLPYLRSL